MTVSRHTRLDTRLDFWLRLLAVIAVLTCGRSAMAQAPAGGFAPTPGTTSWNGNGWGGGGWNGGWGDAGWPGATASRNSWQLGVTGKNMDVGVMIESIAPGSAASRRGLSVGDVIVCVDGDQVGVVGSKIYDMTEELNKHADANGGVTLLVQYRRNGQLRNLPIQLDSNQAGLTGTLVVQNGMVPANSIVTVQLQNETRPYFAIRNGQQTFRATAGTQNAIPFSINFDPSYISPGDRYLVRAFVTYNGNTIYETTQPTYVLTQGNPRTAQLMLSARSMTFAGQQGNPVQAVSYGGYDNISTQVTAAYQRYLGRNPTSLEIAAWHSVPDPEYRIGRLPSELMATQEYFDRTGNNNVAWLERVFTEIIGHVPSSYEQQLWMGRFAEVRYSRTEVIKQMNMVSTKR